MAGIACFEQRGHSAEVSVEGRVLQEPRSNRLILGESHEDFDRVAFAMRVLRVLSPVRMTVAVYECRELRVEQGRDLERGGDARFGILGIPRGASRSHIVLAVAELAGTERTPFVVDLLTAAGQDLAFGFGVPEPS